MALSKKYSNDAYKEALRTEYINSLYLTATELTGFQDMTWPTHGPIIKALEEDSLRKLICVPRGTFKTSVCSVAYPLWLLMRNPNLRIMLDSELYTNCKNYLREIKTHMQSEHFIRLFGDWRSDTWNESEIIIGPRTKVMKDPSILCGGIGTTKVGVHVDVIIGDDYNSPANSQTQDQRKKVIDHYRYNQSILEPNGIYAIIGTRYAEDDLIGWVIKNELGIDTLDKLKSMRREGLIHV